MQPQPYILLAPTDPKAVVSEWIAVAIESHTLGRYPDAERQLRHAIQLEPNNARVWNNLACAYAAGQNHKEALLVVERAVILAEGNDEDSGVARCNWALIALDLEQIDLAINKAFEAVKAYPCTQTRLALALCYPVAGTPEKALPLYNTILDENPKHHVAGMNAAFVQTLLDVPPEELLAQRRRFYDGQRQVGSGLKHHKPSLNGKPIRVGYVSGDYRRHSASAIFGGVILHHSPRVEPYFYSTQPVDVEADPVSKKFKDYAGNRWCDITGMPDDKAEEQIRKDKIDILVDLSGHTGGSRLGLFTRRPAPIQATAWGFAHGTGCPEIDYFLADPIAVPENEWQHYAEKIYDLPCIVTYDPPDCNLSGVSEPPVEKNGYITLGCFSRYEKLSDEYLSACREILSKVPSAKMEFKDNAFRQPHAVRRVLGLMDSIDKRRLSFRIGTSQADHMLAYQRCDLILDPFPHSGGTCCLEQLWMGVPILTRYGTQAAGRTASSVLWCINRGEMVAWINGAEYVDKATYLATTGRKLLADARKSLRQELLRSPVVFGYVAAVEKAYEHFIQEKACADAK